MKNITRKVLAFTMALVMVLVSLATPVHADEWDEDWWEGKPKPSEPINIEMDPVDDMLEIAPGDARQVKYEPIVTGEDGRTYHSRGVMKVIADDNFKDYDVYYTKDVSYTYQDGFSIADGAEMLVPVEEYEDTIDEKPVYVKVYHIAKTTDKLDGETSIKDDLDFTIVVPHEARRLANLKVDTEIEVRYDANDLPVPEEPKPEEPKPEEPKPEEPAPEKPAEPKEPSKPVDSGDVQRALGVSIGFLGVGALIYLIRRNKEE